MHNGSKHTIALGLGIHNGLRRMTAPWSIRAPCYWNSQSRSCASSNGLTEARNHDDLRHHDQRRYASADPALVSRDLCMVEGSRALPRSIRGCALPVSELSPPGLARRPQHLDRRQHVAQGLQLPLRPCIDNPLSLDRRGILLKLSLEFHDKLIRRAFYLDGTSDSLPSVLSSG